MKIVSFKGRRLIADLTPEEVAEKTSIDVNVIKRIEAMEVEIRTLNDFYDNES
jgi:hypothetical protein